MKTYQDLSTFVNAKEKELGGTEKIKAYIGNLIKITEAEAEEILGHALD